MAISRSLTDSSPSFTTVTTVPRYVSMPCAAIKAARTHLGFASDAASSSIRQERLGLVKSFERAWGRLRADLLHEMKPLAVWRYEELRGIRSVNRRLDTLSPREKYIQTGSFNLLSNQVRYGGIGV